MPDKTVLCKITAEDDKSYYLLTTIEEEGEAGFRILLSDGSTAWAGTCDADEIEKLSRKIKMSESVFISESTKALTKENVGSLNFLYQVKKTGDGVQFIWKKHMAADNIKFQLGTVHLKQKTHPSQAVCLMFDEAISGGDLLRDRIASLEADNERLASERASALKRLEKCVDAKDQLEKDLYAKFATVINDKKSRIRSLKQDLESGLGSSTQNSDPMPSTSGRSKKRALESDDEDQKDTALGSDYNTDEEEKESPKPSPSKQGRKGASASTEVKDEPQDGDDDLMLGAGGDTLDSPATPAPRRRRGKLADKKTPSRPIIPKASSTTKAKPSPSTSKKTPLRKSSSRLSDRSSDNADHLLDDL